MQRTPEVDGTTTSSIKPVTGKRKEIEQRLLGLTEQVLRERAATASGPAYAAQQDVWGDLDRGLSPDPDGPRPCAQRDPHRRVNLSTGLLVKVLRVPSKARVSRSPGSPLKSRWSRPSTEQLNLRFGLFGQDFQRAYNNRRARAAIAH